MKIRNNFQKGFTYIEMVVVLTLLLILIVLINVFVDPLSQMKKSRDEKRLTDMSTLDRAINEFLLDNGRYPDLEDNLRVSTTLPSGSLNLNNSNLGWIYDDLSSYLDKQPTDPINDSDYFYSYIQVGTGYEINAVLEYYIEAMVDDGGNDPSVYEVGNSLNLISP
ncbi:type II secretion system protein GspG [Patescibacteria group bacterium]|nr:type II secretion system protein GspG [Patescibacteria group bacterium]